jgi:hypothetical protein
MSFDYKELEDAAVIDSSNLDKESLNIPYLHAKWFRRYIDESRKLKDIEFEEHRVHLHLYEYYTGKASDEVYKKRPLVKKILKGDAEKYVINDELFVAIQKKKMDQVSVVRAIEEFIKQINQRSYHIKNAIESLKFQAGY